MCLKCVVRLATAMFLILLIICPFSKTLGQVSFSRHLLDNNVSGAFTVFAGDITGNGRNDVLAGGQGGKIVLYRNNGNGSFSDQLIDRYGAVWRVSAKDIDKDGKLDIIAASSSENAIAWWKNNGSSFSRRVVDTDLISAEGVSAGDLDGDGDIDMVGVGWNDGIPAVWYENVGNENFIRHTLDANFHWAHDVEVVDINGDGKLDIIGACSSERKLVWWKNNGGGSFSANTIDRNFSGAYCAEPVDLDHDGDIDIISASHILGQVAWWENNGSGNFTKHIISSNFANSHDAVAADIDGDGDLDVAATSRIQSEIAWFENNGHQSFTKHTITSSIGEPQTVFLSDLDNDGDIDVIGQSRTQGTVYWWENTNATESVSTPDRPTGPSSGVSGESLTFSTDGSTSSMGHSVEYQFDWGDGNYSAWNGVTNSHAYSSEGTYSVRARARCEQHTNITSGWSNGLSVTISPPEYSVSGRVSYYSNNDPISDVNIQVTGDVSTIKTTNADGNFSFSVDANSTITLYPEKPKGEDIGGFDITMYDAALTARYALGLEQLADGQQIAADADKSGDIYTFDAALIARYAVGLEPLSSSHVAEWLFIPEERNIQNISSNKGNQNFTGYAIGDVDGGWSNSSLLRKNKYTMQRYKKMDEIHFIENEIQLPIHVEANQNILSVDLGIIYDDEFLRFKKINRSNLADSFKFYENDEEGRLRIGLYTVQPVNEGGQLISVIFERKDLVSQSQASIELRKFLINNVLNFSGKTAIMLGDEHEVVSDYKLFQNYPNPFNSSTLIRFYNPTSGYASIKIFNLSGQEVKTLFEGYIPNGMHQYSWDGSDHMKKQVSAGVYIYKIEMGSFTSVKKLLKIE